MVARNLRRAIARDELRGIGRRIVAREGIERRICFRGIAFVSDRGVHPVREYLRSAGMGVERDVEIGRRQARERIGNRAACSEERSRRLRLIGRHQRAAARIAEQNDFLGMRFFAQPCHARSDVDQRMFETEQILCAAKARIPAEKAEAALGEERRDVMLREIDIVMRGDHGCTRAFAALCPIEPLTRMPSRPGPRACGGSKPDKFPLDGHAKFPISNTLVISYSTFFLYFPFASATIMPRSVCTS
jgi:hypothetical protein